MKFAYKNVVDVQYRRREQLYTRPSCMSWSNDPPLLGRVPHSTYTCLCNMIPSAAAMHIGLYIMHIYNIYWCY